jgi:hypothetical protein
MKTVILVLTILTAASTAWAQNVPERVSYQGVLTDGAGTPVADGSYDITFAIYDAPTGGSALWTETNTVSVTGGLFGLTLGAISPIDLPFDGNYFLGLSVDGGDELSPRRELSSSPYAFNSKHVLGQYNVFGGTGNVGVGTTTPAAPLEVKHNTIDAGSAAIAIDNDTPNGADIIDFKNGGVTGARIRYMWGGDFFIGPLGNHRISLITENTKRLTVGDDGNVVIGGATTAAEKLDVDGAVRIGTTAGSNAGTIRWTGSDFEGYDGAAWLSLTSGGSGGLPSGTNNQTLRHDGSNWVATSGFRVTTDSDGGGAVTYDEADNWTAKMGADASGTGGMFYVQRNASYYGFYVEGNWSGTEEPGMGVTGSARSAVFRMDQSDDASVQLPNNAISAAEILDEPGVASDAVSAITSLTSGYMTLMSRSLTTPAAGFVLAIASMQVNVQHTSGTNSVAEFGVSDAVGGLPANQDVMLQFSGSVPSGSYAWPVSVHGLFEVTTAGSHTFYLIASEVAGNISVGDIQLTTVYFPTAYGTVTPTVVTAGASDDASAPRTGGLTPSELAAERAGSEAANNARIERELAAMRERLGRLETELAAEREGR